MLRRLGFQDSRIPGQMSLMTPCCALCVHQKCVGFLRGCDERVEEDDRGERAWVRGGFTDNAMIMPDTVRSNMMHLDAIMQLCKDIQALSYSPFLFSVHCTTPCASFQNFS